MRPLQCIRPCGTRGRSSPCPPPSKEDTDRRGDGRKCEERKREGDGEREEEGDRRDRKVENQKAKKKGETTVL